MYVSAAKLSSEIGYGNAAGLLFRKGLTGPPEARIEELPDDLTTEDTTSGNKTKISDDRNPITSLKPPSTHQPDPLEGLTQEEKEREAERLFVLFDRMERNPVISAQAGGGGGGGKGVSVTAKDIMRGKLERGELEDDKEAERERKEMEDQEKKDEEEVAAEMKRYRERMGKK